jgi:hypothetical protein
MADCRRASRLVEHASVDFGADLQHVDIADSERGRESLDVGDADREVGDARQLVGGSSGFSATELVGESELSFIDPRPPGRRSGHLHEPPPPQTRRARMRGLPPLSTRRPARNDRRRAHRATPSSTLHDPSQRAQRSPCAHAHALRPRLRHLMISLQKSPGSLRALTFDLERADDEPGADKQ